MELMLLRIFQQQVQLQCQAVVDSAAQLNGTLAAMHGGNMAASTPFWIAMQNLLGAAANISKALWGQGGRLSDQRKPLRESIQVGDDSPLRPVVMRNNFEHYDERLDEWWNESAAHNHLDKSFVSAGSVVGMDEKDMFRVFDPETNDVVFWGQRFNVQDIVTEVSRLLPLLESETTKPHWEP